MIVRKTALLIFAALLVVAALSGCVAADKTENHAEYTTVSLGGFSAIIPADLVLDQYGTGSDALYEDGCVGTDTRNAASRDGSILFTFTEVDGRDFSVVAEWASGLPDSAIGQKSAARFGLDDSFEGAVWDEPVFYDAAGGDGVAVSCLIDGMRWTAHFVDMGNSMYAEVAGFFPEDAYAENPSYYDFVFQSIATDEWMDVWTGRK